jgi:hypothetical protein
MAQALLLAATVGVLLGIIWLTDLMIVPKEAGFIIAVMCIVVLTVIGVGWTEAGGSSPATPTPDGPGSDIDSREIT